MIILEGELLMRNHRESVTAPELLAKYGNILVILVPGDVVGCTELEGEGGGVSRQAEVWFTVHVPVRVAYLPDSKFTAIWEM